MSATVKEVARIWGEGNLDKSQGRLVRQYYVLLTEGSNPFDYPESSACSATDPNTGLTIPSDTDTVTVDGNVYSLNYNKVVSYDPKTPRKMYVRCTYTAASNGTPGGGQLAWQKDIAIDGAIYTDSLFHDLDRKKAISSSRGLLDPLPSRDFRNRKYSISFMAAAGFNVQQLEDAEGCINSDTLVMRIPTWRGPVYQRTFPALTLKINSVKLGTAFVDGAQSAWSVSMELEYQTQKDDNGKEVGWTYLTPDRDTHKLSSGKRVPILEKELPNASPGDDGDGNPITIPAFLDGSGGVLAAEQKAVRLSFRTYDLVPFGPLFANL